MFGLLMLDSNKITVRGWMEQFVRLVESSQLIVFLQPHFYHVSEVFRQMQAKIATVFQ